MKAVYAQFLININITNGSSTAEVEVLPGVAAEVDKGVKDEYWFYGRTWKPFQAAPSSCDEEC